MFLDVDGEDFNLLEDITDRVAVSMEKEYLREQLSEREKELSVINRSSAIISSSFDIQGVFGSFVEELRKIVDVSWAAVVLIGDSELYFLAFSTEIDSTWKVGERVPIKSTATEWVVTHKKLWLSLIYHRKTSLPLQSPISSKGYARLHICR